MSPLPQVVQVQPVHVPGDQGEGAAVFLPRGPSGAAGVRRFLVGEVHAAKNRVKQSFADGLQRLDLTSASTCSPLTSQVRTPQSPPAEVPTEEDRRLLVTQVRAHLQVRVNSGPAMP